MDEPHRIVWQYARACVYKDVNAHMDMVTSIYVRAASAKETASEEYIMSRLCLILIWESALVLGQHIFETAYVLYRNLLSTKRLRVNTLCMPTRCAFVGAIQKIATTCLWDFKTCDMHIVWHLLSVDG
jgi:hypothetical protein